MDVLLLSTVGIFCIEAKWISNDKYTRLSGGALSNSWTLKTKRGTSNTENNGLKQNYGHVLFLRQLFEYVNIECPIYQITVIGNLDRDKIAVQQFIDANLVDEDEIIDRIKYIKERNNNKTIDVDKVEKIIRDWECNVPGKEILHVVYAL